MQTIENLIHSFTAANPNVRGLPLEINSQAALERAKALHIYTILRPTTENGFPQCIVIDFDDLKDLTKEQLNSKLQLGDRVHYFPTIGVN